MVEQEIVGPGHKGIVNKAAEFHDSDVFAFLKIIIINTLFLSSVDL